MKKLLSLGILMIFAAVPVLAQTINYVPRAAALVTSGTGGPPYTVMASASGLGSVNFTPDFVVPMCSSTGAPPYSQCTFGSGSGSVTSFSAGNLSPLFTTSVATATSTPALSFALSNAAQNSVLAGPASGGAGAYSFQTAPTISAANMTNFPFTVNSGTTGQIGYYAGNGTTISGTNALPSGTTAANLAITGGTIDNTVIGGTTPAATAVTTFAAGSGGTASIVVTPNGPTSSPNLNGTYVYAGTYSGWPYYHAPGIGYIHSASTYPTVSYWFIEPTLGGGTNDFYSAQTNGIPPLTTGWTPQNGATGTVQTAAGASLAVDAAGDVLTNGAVTVAGAVTAASVTATNLTQGEPVYPNSAQTLTASPSYRDCSQFAGADDSLKIQACLVALHSSNAQGGIADARGLTGGVWSVNPFSASSAPTSGVLLTAPGNITISQPVIPLDGWGIIGPTVQAETGVNYGIGSNPAGTVLIASASYPATYQTGTVTVGTAGQNDVITGSGTSWSTTNAVPGCAFISPATGGQASVNLTYGIIGSRSSGTSLTLAFGVNVGSGAAGGSTYSIFCPVFSHGNGYSTNDTDGFEYGISAQNISFDCNEIAGCVPELNWFGGQHSFATNVNLYNFCGQGLQWEGLHSQNAGPFDRVNAYPGSCGGASTIPFFVDSSSGTFGLRNISANNGLASTNPNVGVVLNGSGITVDHADLEEMTTAGIGVNDSVTCTPACVGGNPGVDGAAKNMVLTEIHGIGGTAVRLYSNNGSPANIVLTSINNTGGYTDNFIDSPNSCTSVFSSENGTGFYATDTTGKIASSTSATCKASPQLNSATATNLFSGGNTQRLTADSSGITATTPGTTEWTWSNLANSTNYSFHCSILFSQATAAGGVGVSVQSATHAATRWDAWAKLYTTNPASTTVTATLGSTLDITSTTATSVASSTPGATSTVYQGELDGTIQTASTAGTLNVLVYTGSSSDAVTVKAGSYCALLP